MNVTVSKRTAHYRTVAFDAASNSVMLIEQRLLPHHFQIVAASDFHQTAAAIRDMVVRGAGAIGATAAYGLAQGSRSWPSSPLNPTLTLNLNPNPRSQNLASFQRHVRTVYETLAAARPTAVDPVNAMNQVLAVMRQGQTVQEQQALALAAAEEFANEDVRHCQDIGRHGAKLIRNGMTVLTHCNAGWLAFVDIGSATAPIYAAQAAGKKFHVFCDETRPRSQGATLTAWELAQQKVSHQIIADNAAGHLMQRGRIDLVIVGSDRTLGRTGDVANKIGTYTKAVLARRHRIPFYVAIPLSTIDWNLKSGFDIPIEERSESEVLGAWGVPESPTCRAEAFERRRKSDAGGPHSTLHASTLNSQLSTLNYFRVANPTSSALNPGFDVTPAELITGIITPLGIFKPRDLWRHRRELGAPA
jgi:methylthioribose-1-phosphate isomerase